MTKTHIITLEVGDWSNDGHGRSEKFAFGVNADCSVVRKAYKQGKEIVGIDIAELCKEYDDCVIPADIMQKLFDAGFTIDGWEDIDYEDVKINDYWCEPEVFCDIYIFICHKGNPELLFKPNFNDNITIGGYGLYR